MIKLEDCTILENFHIRVCLNVSTTKIRSLFLHVIAMTYCLVRHVWMFTKSHCSTRAVSQYSRWEEKLNGNYIKKLCITSMCLLSITIACYCPTYGRLSSPISCSPIFCYCAFVNLPRSSNCCTIDAAIAAQLKHFSLHANV